MWRSVLRFPGSAGDLIALTLVETTNWGGSFGASDALGTLRAPSGTVVGTYDSNTQPQITWPESGTYVIQLNANNLVSTGSFNLSLTCF